MTEETKWQLVNPEGVLQAKAPAINPRPASLEGKTVLLRWNGKHNGDVFLSRVGELLVQSVPGLRIVKNWEVASDTVTISPGQEVSTGFARKSAAFNPDLVIGSQGD
ncbi:MAG: hypothetical protein V1737_03665 [Chloroflexota bacterium]